MRKSIQKTRQKRVDPVKKVKLKTGDDVTVTTGDHKGKIGKVIRVIKKYSKLVISGVNVKKVKIYDLTKSPQKGKYEYKIVARECPVRLSNVMFYDMESATHSRLGYKIGENGEKTRIVKKTGRELKN